MISPFEGGAGDVFSIFLRVFRDFPRNKIPAAGFGFVSPSRAGEGPSPRTGHVVYLNRTEGMHG